LYKILKKYLYFDINKYIFIIGPEFLSNTIIFSSSSPFKVTTEENIPQVVQPLQMESTSNRKEKNLFDLSDYQPSQQLLNLSADYQPAQKDKLLGRYNMYCITI